MKPTLVITGASGFIGKNLCAYFLQRGYSVLGLSRSPVHFKAQLGASFEWRFFDLEQGFDGVLPENSVLVHAAYSTQETDRRLLEKVNLVGTKVFFKKARQLGAQKIIFISSMAAHEDAESFYGKSKLALEKELLTHEVALRPGLVLGNGGLFARLLQSIQTSPVIPLFYGGEQEIQILWVEDLCEAVLNSLLPSVCGVFFVAHPDAVLLTTLYQKIGSLKQKQLKFIKLPGALFYFGLRLFEIIGLSLPITSENLLGLKKMKVFSVQNDLNVLNVVPLDIDAALKKLI